jgi:hypothetical protein
MPLQEALDELNAAMNWNPRWDAATKHNIAVLEEIKEDLGKGVITMDEAADRMFGK